MTTGRVLELLDELSELGTLMLTFSGGEPLLRADWHEIACHARRRGFSLSFLTNGALIDASIANRLSRLHATVLLSLPAVVSSTGRALTGVEAGAEQAVHALGVLRKRQVRTVIRFLATTLNLRDLPAIRTLAMDAGAELRIMPSVLPRLSGSTAPLGLRVALEELEGVGWSPCEISPPGALPPDAAPCGAGWWHACIHADGLVSPCAVFPSIAGDATVSTFREIWASETFRRLRAVRVVDLATCTRCGRLPTCNRCPALALLEGGNLLGPEPRACELAAVRGPEGESRPAHAGCDD
jgi:AdoMet-dependent heme synthase